MVTFFMTTPFLVFRILVSTYILFSSISKEVKNGWRLLLNRSTSIQLSSVLSFVILCLLINPLQLVKMFATISEGLLITLASILPLGEIVLASHPE